MARGLLPVVAAAAIASGCDHFRVESFHGSRFLMTIGGALPTEPGHHLELWAREGADEDPRKQNIVRIMASEGGKEANGDECSAGNTCLPAAFSIAPVFGAFDQVMDASGNAHASLKDGCMIDATGNLVWTPEAIDPNTGMAQGRSLAGGIQRRIDELTIGNAAPLLAVIPWDDNSDNVRPSVTDTAAVRLSKCRQLWAASAAAYSGNPTQTTAPVHGSLIGVVDFTSLMPPQVLGGLSFSSSYALHHLRELFLTDTTAAVGTDPTKLPCGATSAACRGTVLLDGVATVFGAGSIHFELHSPFPDGPQGGLSGSATIEIQLDQDSQQF